MITLDAHVDVPWQFTKQGDADLSQDCPGRDLDFPRMKKGGLDAFVAALYLPDAMQDRIGDKASTDETIRQIHWLNCQGFLVWDEVPKADDHQIFLALEGGRLLHESLEQLEFYASFGLRILTLTHNFNTSWCDSATDVPNIKGLTPFGESVVKRCEELGIIVDISHVSDASASAVLDIATKPVIASHSGVRALIDHPRNLSDELIKRIATSGGVIGIPFARRFVGNKSEGVVNAIDHIASLLGDVVNIAIGSDLDGATLCDDIKDVTAWSRVTEALDDDTRAGIDLVRGGNLLRVLG